MKVVVTGGAGFIGSHLVRSYLEEGHELVVLDDLSTGFPENVPGDVELIEGSITDLDLLQKAMVGAELVFHEAAARAVSRSVDDPIGTDHANTHGTLNVLVAARDAGVRRVVLASSSSVYGGVAPLPTPESSPLTPKSPYAVTKVAGEHYARVFSELYAIETVCLRYFNVFGPRQRPDSAYAAVIPLFIDAVSEGRPAVVHGDGNQSRDFTYIDDVVLANRLAASAPTAKVNGRAYNVARGEQTSMLDLLNAIGAILDREPKREHIDPRPGDVRHSRADISAAREDLGFAPQVDFQQGLARTVEWFLSR